MAQMLRRHKSGEKIQRVVGGMAPRIIMCEKSDDGKRCKDGEAPGDGSELAGDHRLIAHAAKVRALSVLEDALKKKKQLLMEPPELLLTEGPNDNGPKLNWLRRYAVLTEQRVTHLKSVLEVIRLKEDSGEKFKRTYAYMHPSDESRTVYLCPLFWGAPVHLETDSQPGTLIHEASHFLGSKDLAYGVKHVISENFCDHGRVIRRESGASIKPSKEIEQVIKNADSIEYEIEITLKHKGEYTKSGLGYRYTCCGERNEASVCINSVSSDFLTYHEIKRDMAVNVIKDADEMLRQSDTLSKQQKQRGGKADFLSGSSDSRKNGREFARMMGWLSLDPPLDARDCIECVEGIVALSRRVLQALHEFHDFQWPEGETFAEGLHSVAEEILELLCLEASAGYGGGTFRQRALLLDQFVDEVKLFRDRVLSIEDLHTFT